MKVIKPGSSLKYNLREISMQYKLRHKHIVALHGVCMHMNNPILVMERGDDSLEKALTGTHYRARYPMNREFELTEDSVVVGANLKAGCVVNGAVIGKDTIVKEHTTIAKGSKLTKDSELILPFP